MKEAAFPVSDCGRRIAFQYHRPSVGILGDLPSPVASSLVWPLSLVYSVPRLCWDLAPHSALGSNWEAEQARVHVVPKH